MSEKNKETLNPLEENNLDSVSGGRVEATVNNKNKVTGYKVINDNTNELIYEFTKDRVSGKGKGNALDHAKEEANKLDNSLKSQGLY